MSSLEFEIRALQQHRVESGGMDHKVSHWIAMLVAEQARRQYRAERRLSDELGFDVVDLGGES